MRAARPVGLDTRARAALFHNTTLDLERALAMQDEEITFDLMVRTGVREHNCTVASLGPQLLKERGAASARHLRDLGFDSVSLCAPELCNEAVLAFGAEDVRAAFVTTAIDAVRIAGRAAQYILDLAPAELLALCAGCPREAAEVLRQLPAGTALEGVSAGVLLDAGVRAPTLAQHGYGLATVLAHVAPNEVELRKLGYGLSYR